jgi:FAD/FMN-containing dehydrogenase
LRDLSRTEDRVMGIHRRDFLKAAGLVAIGPAWPAIAPDVAGTLVNDIHSQLNSTRVARIVPIDSVKALQGAVRRAAADRTGICIAGGRHAMGGQQFAAGGTLLDMRPCSRVLRLDAATGIVDVESGIMWPALIDELVRRQAGSTPQWGIAQKQTGADRLTIGGALAANVHGRGLKSRGSTAVSACGAVRRSATHSGPSPTSCRRRRRAGPR